jgi:hypothetical protein
LLGIRENERPALLASSFDSFSTSASISWKRFRLAVVTLRQNLR